MTFVPLQSTIRSVTPVSILLSTFLLVPSNVSAEECQWATGQAMVTTEERTAREAKTLALREARASAIAQATGTQIDTNRIIINDDMVADLIQSRTQGYIVEEKDHHWSPDFHHPAPATPPIPILKVTIKACVLATPKPRDAGFRLRVDLNQTLFRDGDAAVLTITPTRDAYVTVFNLTGKDQMLPLENPPHLQFPIHVKKNHPWKVPHRPGITIKMKSLPNFKQTTEAFIVIATQDHVDLKPQLFGEQPHVSADAFLRDLFTVPGIWTYKIAPYKIIAP